MVMGSILSCSLSMPTDRWAGDPQALPARDPGPPAVRTTGCGGPDRGGQPFSSSVILSLASFEASSTDLAPERMSSNMFCSTLPSSTLLQFSEFGTNRPLEAALTTTAAVASPAFGLNDVEFAM